MASNLFRSIWVVSWDRVGVEFGWIGIVADFVIFPAIWRPSEGIGFLEIFWGFFGSWGVFIDSMSGFDIWVWIRGATRDFEWESSCAFGFDWDLFGNFVAVGILS